MFIVKGGEVGIIATIGKGFYLWFVAVVDQFAGIEQPEAVKGILSEKYAVGFVGS
jgi:hypothetical protein